MPKRKRALSARPPLRCGSCAAALELPDDFERTVVFCSECHDRVEALQESEGLHCEWRPRASPTSSGVACRTSSNASNQMAG